MVEQKAKLKQQISALKVAENSRIPEPKCATKKKFRHSRSAKIIDVY